VIELPFLVPPQMTVGRADTTVGITVSASPTIFPDHDEFVTVTVCRIAKPFQQLEQRVRVPASERGVDAALREMAVKVGAMLDREDMRLRKLLPH